MKSNILIRFIFVIVISFIAVTLGLIIGGGADNLENIFRIILHKLFGMNLKESISPTEVSIIWNIRFPRVLLAFMVGGMLSVSGVIIQSVLRNPLASSYTMGISSGASLGIGIFTVGNISFLGYDTSPIVGFVFSVLSILFVISLCRKFDKSMSNNTIVLVGMVMSLFLNSIFILITSIRHESLSSIIVWQLGSFSSRGWEYIFSIIPCLIIGVILAIFYSKELDIITFGDDMSKSVGVNVSRIKIVMLILVSILTGASIAASGVIGFIDLIVPHISRKLFGSKHIVVILSSLFIGGILMVLFDIISRTIIYPAEIPIATINALIGTPIFCYIFFREYRR
ncbi:FecCD family ABC transporter permease [Candidatus Arthromitus sp. SFB-rat-Yit]|uniref:FecCD family ABC transporter permease n=1 Tax=Candidatus Arthromitus sp. SFB-rat-Yit TaxID=1041504 RepID=UPI000227A35F|nr:iron ABC transporter permease [Candidatus Arthromitus sp. SFB-rat-Yit]BAK80852.1 iron chelate uptake ABC transporter, FeCT family, permease protein [Candidatus Arthromitus sp. SFB-rat-Yit]